MSHVPATCLADLTRQSLSVHSRILSPDIKASFEAGNKVAFDRLSARWLHLMQELDTVLGTNQQLMLGPWLANAKTFAHTTVDWAGIDYDARSLITIWGGSELDDYARREWQGLVGDYYYSRWELYFDSLDNSLTTGTKPEKIDWYAFGSKWAHKQNT